MMEAPEQSIRGRWQGGGGEGWPEPQPGWGTPGQPQLQALLPPTPPTDMPLSLPIPQCKFILNLPSENRT